LTFPFKYMNVTFFFPLTWYMNLVFFFFLSCYPLKYKSHFHLILSYTQSSLKNECFLHSITRCHWFHSIYIICNHECFRKYILISFVGVKQENIMKEWDIFKMREQRKVS
jgi:hypothetical protein